MVDLDRTALIDCERELTFNQMISEADEIASFAPARSLVFLVAGNSIPSLCGYVGFLRKRVVPVMLRDEMSEAQLRGLAETYLPTYWWAPQDFIEEHKEAIGSFSVEAESGGYALLSTGNSAPEMDEELGLLLTTSGSTGTPKFVRLTYANIVANAASIAEYQRITDADRAITTLPFSYSYGISIVNSHLLKGASLALTEEGVLSRGFWDFLAQTKATNFGGVPYTYTMLERLHLDRMDLPSLRFISQAGGRLGERLQEVFGKICEDKGIEFFVMYGQTEATARMSWLPPNEVLEKLGSIGIAIPKGRFELRDVDDSVIEEAEKPGELIYYGPNVSLGYAQTRADLALGDERHGVLYTGDVAKRDEDGFYYVVGRLKRFLKIYGNRVNLDEMEKLFTTAEREVACVGVDDLMQVFTTSDDVEGLRKELSHETKLNSRAFKVNHIDELPRTSSGKLDYAALERLC